MQLQEIKKEQFQKLHRKWQTGEPVEKALFYLKEGTRYIAVDNTTGDFWTEEFPAFEPCKQWLYRK